VFDVAPGAANADLIIDFGSEGDTIVLDGNAHANIGASGAFALDDPRFFQVAGASSGHDADDRVIYDTSTGRLWYDADGSGAGAAQLIATSQDRFAGIITAGDIVVVNGTPSGSVINGTEGDETLFGTFGDDTINGLGGNDHLEDLAGDDLLDGGSGSDTLLGAAGNDTVLGGSDDDMAYGGGGDDHVFGGDGDDILDFETTSGNDTLDGGAGNDRFYVNIGDVLVDSSGVDTVITNVSWTLGAGLENLSFVNFTLRDDGLPGLVGTGNGLANRMSTYPGDGGTLDGMAGNDTLIGGFRGADTLIGNAGNDVLTGDLFADDFVFNVAPGAANADQITDFMSGSDRIVLDARVHASLGASGNFASEASEVRFAANESGMAEDGADRVILDTTSGEVWYDADGSGPGARQLIVTTLGGSTPTSTDFWVINGTAGGSVINGTSGNDALSGTSASETINGLAGNDTIAASAGNDTINGGDGRDSIEYKSAATSGVVVDWVSGTIDSSAGSVTFTSIERVAGGNFADAMAGDAAAQNLTGQGGADTLWGANGADTLWGNSGGDFFVFREMGTANADRISDFVTGADEIQLDDAAFSAIGALGGFSAGDARFWSSTSGTAHDASDRVIYNTETGQLYYDADGNGGGAAQLIATVVNDPALVASDISVI
jgi:serralysin